MWWKRPRSPHRDIPRAMVLTLLISTILYVAVAAIAVSAVAPDRLSSSPAPLSLVFREVAGISPVTISAIAIVATLNTILAQMTMSARVIYGMARHGDLPRIVGRVHPRTATPLFATALIAASGDRAGACRSIRAAGRGHVAGDARGVRAGQFVVAAAAPPPRALAGPHVSVPVWVPAAGLATCLAMIASAFL